MSFRRTRRVRALMLACATATVALPPTAQAMPIDSVGHGQAKTVSLGDTAASQARAAQAKTVSLGDTAASQARAAEEKALDTALAQERYFSSYGTQVHAPTSSLAGTTGSNELPGPVTVTKAEGDDIAWPAIVIGAGGALLLCLGAFAVVHTSRRVRRAPLGG
jgi:hypothetical protein